MLRDESVLIDIIESARSAISFAADMSLEVFLEDRRTQKAIIYDIQTVGEAVKRLSREFCERHSEIPWSLMAGMCDKLVHDYDRVDLSRVWLVVKEDLPVLLQKLEKIMKEPDERG